MKNQRIISVKALEALLRTWNFGAQPASVQYVTTPDWVNVATARQFPDVKKIANVQIFLGAIYENSVNNELEREGLERDFVAKPLWNGKGRRINTVLAEHTEKGTKYLTIKPQNTLRSIFFDMAKLIVYGKSELIPYLKPYVAPANQGVTEGKEISHREILLTNVRRLKFKKVTYIIDPVLR